MKKKFININDTETNWTPSPGDIFVFRDHYNPLIATSKKSPGFVHAVDMVNGAKIALQVSNYRFTPWYGTIEVTKEE